VACGAELGSSQAFCGDCGIRQPELSNSEARDRIARDGERKRATVLFADIVGSTELISGLHLEQSATVLDRVLRGMANIVALHRGFVSGLRGDGVKAVFGMPLAREDHAERACAAAIALREMGRSARVRLRIGLHSGEVLVRRLQESGHEEYDAVGLPVHLAARLEQLAIPNSICLSAATARLVAGRFNVRFAGRASAKGIAGEIEVFELLGGGRGTRFSARLRGGLSRFVGRASELDRLATLLREDVPAIGIRGDPGVGKSRLIHELLGRRAVSGWTVLRAEADPDDQSAGLRPFAEMLRHLLHIGRRDTPDQVRQKLDRRLADFGEPETLDRCGLYALLDVRDRPPPGEQKPRVVEAFANFIRGESGHKPTLLVVEDVHWLNEDGLQILRRLLRLAEPGRCALIVTSRKGGIFLQELAHLVELGPLADKDAQRLLVDGMGTIVPGELAQAALLQRAGGIPLFIEELAQFSADQASPGAIPDSIHAVIGERIDRLPFLTRDLLRIAAAIGQAAPLPLLSRISVCNEDELAPHLRILEQGGFARVEIVGDERALSFGHILIREVALAGLVSSDRAAIHRAVMEAYEALHATRLDEHVERLGRHAGEAGAWEKAADYLSRAAQKAIDRSSHASAIAFVEQGLDAIERSGLAETERVARELALRLQLRTAHNAIGNYRERLGNLARAEVLAQRTGRDDVLPTIWVSRASAVLQLGRVDDALSLCEKAWKTAEQRRDPDAAIIAGYMLSRTRFYAGRLVTSCATATRTLAVLRAHAESERHGGGFGTSLVMLLIQLAQTNACLGRLAEARLRAAEALAAARASRRSFDLALASYGHGVIAFYAGDLGAAVAVLEEGISASTNGGDQSIHAPLTALLALAYDRAGRTSEAIALTRSVLAYPERSLYHANWPRLFGCLVMHGAGEADALALVRAARTTARKGGYPVQLVWCDLAQAWLMRESNPALALRHLRGALAASERMGLRPCAVRALFGLAALAPADKSETRMARRAARLARMMGVAATITAWL
jgi:class 3 adenylate cyclase/tetratricopeptide (TPR) repeat protein